jgi:hypothetical protein
MGRIDRRWYADFACLLTVLVVAAPALAQTQRQIDWWKNRAMRFSAVLTINGCDAAIRFGRWVGKNLGWAIYNRGTAYPPSRGRRQARPEYLSQLPKWPRVGVPSFCLHRSRTSRLLLGTG